MIDRNTNIVISVHARKRITERVIVSPNKVDKMVAKAWRSTLDVPKVNRLEYSKQFRDGQDIQSIHHRFYMGYVWVFGLVDGSNPRIILITVY